MVSMPIRLLCAALVMTLSSFAEAGLQADKYARVYKGQEGIQVTVVNLKHDATQKLVLVTGVLTRIDDAVLLHTEISDGTGTALQTIVDDKKFWTLRSAESRWGGKRLLLTLPENPRKKVDLYYDAAESKKVDAPALVARYEKQLADGVIKKIQLYQGNDLKPRTNGEFRRTVRRVGELCGGGIGAKIDWSSVKSADTKKLPIASLCSLPADMLARACDKAPDKKLAGKISGITCSVGPAQKLSMGPARRLLWRIPATKPVAVDALTRQFTKIFKATP